MPCEWAQKSPRWFACLWFASWRLAWGIYWFGITLPMSRSSFGFPTLVSGILPIISSALMAAVLGFVLGHSIATPDGTKSYWAAGLMGIVIQHLTTVLYLPIDVLIRTGFVARQFFGSLYLSFILSLAGIPIHTLIGALTGILLYRISGRKSSKRIRPM